MKTFAFKQRSDAWFEARRGLPTCSSFDQIITPGQGKPSASQEKLINELIAEELCPTYGPGYSSAEMDAGAELEAEARRFYEFCESAGEPVIEVGLVLSDCGRFGGSPDGLVGEFGGIEIKCPNAATHVSYLRADGLPNDYKCQVHGYLALTGRKWWDFMSYYPGMPRVLVRVQPDEFTGKLAAEVERFCQRYDEARTAFKLPPIADKPRPDPATAASSPVS